MPDGDIEYVWRPQPGPQKALIDCPLPEVFYGGARGGGKTDGVLGKWAVKEQRYGEHFNAVMFRKTTVSADDAIERAIQLYCPCGAIYNASRLQFRMPNGGRVSFRYLESVQDADNYQGRNVTDVWVEEAGQYATPLAIDRLNAVLRSPHGVPTQLILTANPGGAGQHWLSERYKLIPLPESPQIVRRELPDGSTMDAAVIPSRLTDNAILTSSDPNYRQRLYMSGPEALVKAWLDGDWSAVEGAYFDCWDSSKHVIRPFSIPGDWLRFRSMDWGSAAPFSIGWWAVAGEDTAHESGLIPKGAMVRYREWYGTNDSSDKLTVEDLAEGIKDREQGEPMAYGVADPSMWAEDGGPSMNERMAKRGVFWRKADNKRIAERGHVGGWDMMRSRLIGRLINERMRPMLYTFSTCKDSIRTIPTLQHNEKKPEDLDTTSEDHAADEWRYACMSRPWVAKAPEKARKRDGYDTEDEVDTWRTV